MSVTGAIWIRLIMTTVYNAYQSYVLYVSYDHLMSEACINYLSFNKCRSEEGKTFANFNATLAQTINIPKSTFPKPITTEKIVVKVTYGKRFLFCPGGKMEHVRLNGIKYHQKAAIPPRKGKEEDDEIQQLCCVLCCRNNHDNGQHCKP
jgi:hypothetical protein